MWDTFIQIVKRAWQQKYIDSYVGFKMSTDILWLFPQVLLNSALISKTHVTQPTTIHHPSVTVEPTFMEAVTMPMFKVVTVSAASTFNRIGALYCSLKLIIVLIITLFLNIFIGL